MVRPVFLCKALLGQTVGCWRVVGPGDPVLLRVPLARRMVVPPNPPSVAATSVDLPSLDK
jgi:hypothetical protein